jgi:hypothetical protein
MKQHIFCKFINYINFHLSFQNFWDTKSLSTQAEDLKEEAALRSDMTTPSTASSRYLG